MLAFGGLAVATVAAFFIIQHLKVATPLIAGKLALFPTQIDPRDGATCLTRTPEGKLAPVSHARTSLSFFLVHRADNVSVYVVNQRGRVVATLASDLYMPAELFPHQIPRVFTWNGRESSGQLAPAGRYSVKVALRRQDRTIDIAHGVKVEYSSRCPGT